MESETMDGGTYWLLVVCIGKNCLWLLTLICLASFYLKQPKEINVSFLSRSPASLHAKSNVTSQTSSYLIFKYLTQFISSFPLKYIFTCFPGPCIPGFSDTFLGTPLSLLCWLFLFSLTCKCWNIPQVQMSGLFSFLPTQCSFVWWSQPVTQLYVSTVICWSTPKFLSAR